MLDMERYLVEKSGNVFQFQSSQSDPMWSDIIPLQWTDEIMKKVGLKADAVKFAEHYNKTAPKEFNEAPEGGSSTALLSPRATIDPTLIRLATAVANVVDAPYTREALDAGHSQELLQHIADPEQCQSPFKYKGGEETLLYILKSRHVQTIAFQEIARELGWFAGAAVSFIPRKARITQWEIDEMDKQGVRVHDVVVDLTFHHFDQYVAQFLVSI